MDATDPGEPKVSSSPPWSPGARLVAGVLLVLGLAFLLDRLKDLATLFVLALLMAYVLWPVVGWLEKRLRFPRWLAVVALYVVLIVAFAGSTTGIGLVVSQQLVGLVQDLTAWAPTVPERLSELSTLRVAIGPWTLDMARVNLQPALSALASALQPLLSQTGGMLASLAGTTATVLGKLVLILVMGFYLLLDLGRTGDIFVRLVPERYGADYRRLAAETGRVWQAFVRGQLILGLALAVVVAVVLAALGVRFAIILGVIAGLLEFIPFFGPFLAGAAAVLMAFFQGVNPWGLSPLGFAAAVLVAFVVIQQLESNFLAPRIIGESLRLHPLAVLLAALAGGSLAGLIGVLLAAPVVATLRVWLGYAYRKTMGIETWPEPRVLPAATRGRARWRERLSALLRRPILRRGRRGGRNDVEQP
jgi:predicted PurR-regulated permease PerM